MNTKIWIAIIVIALAVGGFLLLAGNDEDGGANTTDTVETDDGAVSNQTPEPGSETDETVVEGSKETVTYTNDGFEPANITVKAGTTVRFINATSGDFWPASDPHPVHTGLSGFDAGEEIEPGGSYEFTFNEVGVFSYHNHPTESDAGSVTVE